MFFFGLFSSLLPYIIIAGVYTAFMITMSFNKQAKVDPEEPEVKNLIYEAAQINEADNTLNYFDATTFSVAVEVDSYPIYHVLLSQWHDPPGCVDAIYFGECCNYALFPIPPPVS